MTAEPNLAKGGYHHGNLKSALIVAADAIIREKGIEGFSLREAARRAGVSIGAPAHHFGSAIGLLTEVALLGYESLGEVLNGVAVTGDPARDLRRLALAYVGFALAHPGRFRLMFRPDLVNRDDPRYAEFSARALSGFATAIARRQEAGQRAGPAASEDAGQEAGQEADRVAGQEADRVVSKDRMADLFVVWSSIHGMANLVVDGKAKYLFGGTSPEHFVEATLPGLLATAWPFGADAPDDSAATPASGDIGQ
jgi:AcrR family transcriptional regulator